MDNLIQIIDNFDLPSDTIQQSRTQPTQRCPLSLGLIGTTIAAAIFYWTMTTATHAATVDCEAARPSAGSVLYLYFPTSQDTDFPDDPGGWGISTSPLEAFDITDLDQSVGTTAQLRNTITEIVKTDYCEFDVRVEQSTSSNGTTNPTPSDARWQVIGIGSDDNSGLFGIAQDFDEFDEDEMDFARVWAGSFASSFGGSGGALEGTNSTLERWANAIAGTVTHEAGHDYGPDHPDANPVTGEDGSENHIMSSPSGEARAQDRHFSNTSFEILARNLGLYEQTVSNWDFINPNDSTATGFSITVLVQPGDGTPTAGSIYTGGLSPWGNVSISADGSEVFKDINYNRFQIDFTEPQNWNNGGPGEIPAGEDFHVGVGLTTDYIVRNVEFSDAGGAMDLRPRVVGYTTGGSFDPSTGKFHVTFSNAEPEGEPLILSDFVVRYLPRTVDINEMVNGGSLTGSDGNPVEPWLVRGAEEESYVLVDKTDVNIGSLSNPRAVDFIATPDQECGLIEAPPVEDPRSPNQMIYCRDGHILGLFPSARIYIEATVTDPDATYFDRDLGRFVTGPLKQRIFAQLAGVSPDLNDNGIDDAIDLSSGECDDVNRNGVCDDSEPKFRYAAKVVCGVQDDPKNLRLARGKYATAINILNPNETRVKFTKTLSLTFPPEGSAPGAVLSLGKAHLEPGEAVEVDCIDIQRKLYPQGLPSEYLKGFVLLKSDHSLDVTGVYTANGLAKKVKACRDKDNCEKKHHRKHDCGEKKRCQDTPRCGDCKETIQQETISIDIESIRERTIELVNKTESACADLIIRKLSQPDVSCPKGAGSCKTKLQVSIANIGEADAGAFKLQTILDPRQSVTVNSNVPGGLAAGSTANVSIETKPGDNCFDPNCSIHAIVDSRNGVRECREDNNRAKQTTQG